MPKEHVKSIQSLLKIDVDIDTFLENQVSDSKCDAEKVIRLFSALEMMIVAITRELLLDQLQTSFDSGVLWNLKTKILTQYFDRKPITFLRLLREAAGRVSELPLREGLSLSYISLAENNPLRKAEKIRNQIAHRACFYFGRSFRDLATESEVDLTFDEFYVAIQNAIHVLHEIYNYAPINELEIMNEPEREP